MSRMAPTEPAIIDVEKPEAPRLYQLFNPGGLIKDASDIVVRGDQCLALSPMSRMARRG